MARLYEVADHADVTLLEILARRANSIRDGSVVSGLAVSAILMVERIVGLVAESYSAVDGAQASAHLFSIPRVWRDAPAEVWRERLHSVSQGQSAVTEDWRRSWRAWIEMVGTVRDAQETQ